MIVIVDYGLGNLGSVKKAIEFVGEKPIITNDVELIKKAEGIILPGVGAFNDAMNKINDLGLKDVLINSMNKGIPFLGICLGLQMLFEKSQEGDEEIEGIGCFKGTIKRFSNKLNLKVPQIGWNSVDMCKDTPLLSSIKDESYFYFVHSYYLDAIDKDIVVGKTLYGEKFDSVIQKGNVFATQFHPEKSGEIGLKLLENFIKIIRNRR